MTAGVPETAETAGKPRHAVPEGVDAYVPFFRTKTRAKSELPPPRAAHRWRSIAWLESLGLLPEFADRLELKLRSTHGSQPPEMPIAEWTAVRETLATFWRPAAPRGRRHGPAACVHRAARLRQDDGAVQMAYVRRAQRRASRPGLAVGWRNGEHFGISVAACEMIGAPVERFWNGLEGAEDLLFVDLPGVECHSAAGMKALREQLSSLPAPHIHLVLNAAYETALLFEEFNWFAPLMPEDLIFTHLDEENRRVKLWNFVLGTNCSLGWLGGGQKIPGEFHRAESSLLFPHKNLR